MTTQYVRCLIASAGLTAGNIYEVLSTDQTPEGETIFSIMDDDFDRIRHPAWRFELVDPDPINMEIMASLLSGIRRAAEILVDYAKAGNFPAVKDQVQFLKLEVSRYEDICSRLSSDSGVIHNHPAGDDEPEARPKFGESDRIGRTTNVGRV